MVIKHAYNSFLQNDKTVLRKEIPSFLSRNSKEFEDLLKTQIKGQTELSRRECLNETNQEYEIEIETAALADMKRVWRSFKES